MRGARGLIVAISPERVIGVGNALPWCYPGDQRRFKRVTLDSAVIMGRKTWESVGRALPKRRNIVITSGPAIEAPGDATAVETFRDIPSALATTGETPVWFIGGARIYEEGMRYADFIDVTYIPDHVTSKDAVRFPEIPAKDWLEGPLLPHEDEASLTRRVYTRTPPRE